jgi:hypothetical protein
MEPNTVGGKSKVAIGTIRRMEAFDGEIVSYTSTLSKVTQAMESPVSATSGIAAASAKSTPSGRWATTESSTATT